MSRHRRPHSPVRRRVAIAVVVGTVAVAALSAAAMLSGVWAPTQSRAEHGALSAPSGAPASDEASPSPSPRVQGDCGRPVGPAPVVKVTEVEVGVRVTGYGRERDTDPLPMAIAAAPDGGSWLAWLGTDNRVYLGRLDCDDKLIGTPTSFEAIDLQDVHADSTGGVILLTRRGNCGGGRLCGLLRRGHHRAERRLRRHP